MPKLLLVDANNLLCRCIHATYRHDMEVGVCTGGLYGMVSALSAALLKTKADGVAMIYDGAVPKFRMDLLPDYKRKRREQKAADDPRVTEMFKNQMDASFHLCKRLGILAVKFKDAEADDVIAAVCRGFENHDRVVFSNDRDLFQCVAFGAAVYRSIELPVLDRRNFEKETGVPPPVYMLYRALCGDTSDGISGVPGIGPKRAQGILKCAWDEARPSMSDAWDSGSNPTVMELSVELLRRLVLTGKNSERKWERELPEHAERIQNTVLPAISLEDSADADNVKAALLRKDAERVPLEISTRSGFMRWCVDRDYGFLIAQQSMLQPFLKLQTGAFS